MAKRPASLERQGGESVSKESLYQDVEKVLKIEGGVFIPRSSRFEKERGRRIDGGWKARIAQIDKSAPPVILAEKPKKGDKADMHPNVPISEVIRLNTGRNRGALEYVFKGADTPERTDLINAVDRADDFAEAREKLTEFFRKEALLKARKMLKGTPIKLKARTVEEMTEEIGEKLHEAEDLTLKNLQEIITEAEKNEKATKAAAAQGKSDEHDVKDAEADVAAARRTKHHFETQWKTDVQELFSLIDLSGQFTR